MGTQKNSQLPSRTSGNAKTTTVITDKIPTPTLSNGEVNKIIVDYSKLKEIFVESKEQAIADNVTKEQEERKNSITFFKTPSNEDVEKLMKCYNNLPHILKNIEVRNMRSSFELDLDDDDFEGIDLDADFEGVAIEAKRDGTVQHFLSLPMQEDFVNAINTNTAILNEKYNTLRSRYIETDDEGNVKTIKPFDDEYQTEYDNIVKEEYDFLFGENSIIKLFEDSKQDVIEKLVENDPKDKEFKNEFKKLKKNLKIEVEFSDPIQVVTGIDYVNGIVTNVKTKSINTKLSLTLKYPRKSGGTPKEIYSKTFNLLDN